MKKYFTLLLILLNIGSSAQSFNEDKTSFVNFVKKNTHPSELNFDKHLPLGDVGYFVRNNLLDFKEQKRAFLIPNYEIKNETFNIDKKSDR